MSKLPSKFLEKMAKKTGIQIPNLSRYLSGGAIPRPERAKLLSQALSEMEIDIPAADFVFHNKEVKENILNQLKGGS